MTLLSLQRMCPRCSKSFIPWRVWAITRWTCIACPHCGARLNRELDWRFAVFMVVGLSVLQIGALLLMVATPWPFWILGFGVFLGLFWIVDILTIRLVVASKS